MLYFCFTKVRMLSKLNNLLVRKKNRLYFMVENKINIFTFVSKKKIIVIRLFRNQAKVYIVLSILSKYIWITIRKKLPISMLYFYIFSCQRVLARQKVNVL